MELFIIVGITGVFVALAVRFGYDSQARLRSKEEEMAYLGMIWEVDDAQLRERSARPYFRGCREFAPP